jgi:signal transduction histidine kinase
VALSATALPTWVERDPQRAADESRRLAGSAEQAAQQARAILSRMRADQPDRPLAEVLGERCRAFGVEHDVDCRFSCSVVVDLPSDTRYETVAVVEEALRNVAAHADASRVDVRVTVVGDEAEVVVVDNGRGFVPRADGDGPRGRYGLRGMRERAALIGGSLEIASAPGDGTVVTLRVRRGGSP